MSTDTTVSGPDTILGAVDLDTGTAYIWVNPDAADFFDPADGGSADATMTDVKFQGPFDHIILNGRNNTGGSPIFDDIRVATESSDLGFTTIPEPSSTALLGLGGLALILRRRK